MAEQRIAVAVIAPDSNATLVAIEDLEKRGTAAWMISGSASGGDSLSVFAAAAGRRRTPPKDPFSWDHLSLSRSAPSLSFSH